MEISKKKKNKIRVLVKKCNSKQGGYLPAHHGFGSWATTYSTEFINSACELYILFQEIEFGDPLYLLSIKFRTAGIRSCRGSEFCIDRVEYLYKTDLRHRIEAMRTKKKRNQFTIKLLVHIAPKWWLILPSM